MIKQLTVEEGSAGERLDIFLASKLPELSRSQLQELIVTGKVSGDRSFSKSRLPVQIGERIVIDVPDPDRPLISIPGELPVLYEDSQIIVVDKPAGLQTHPNSFEEGTSVIQIILYMRPEIAAAVYDPESEISRLRPGIVHRLDKDTTGVLLIAKTRETVSALATQFRLHMVTKTYETLLSGTLLEARTVDAPLQRKPGRENMMGIAKNPSLGREAISHFRPITLHMLPGNLPVSHVSCQIETGRTHQIRAHAKSIGMPVIGDSRYANRPSEAIAKKLHVSRQLLHAKELSFTHGGEQLKITSPLPADFQDALTRLIAFDNAPGDMLT